MDLNEMLIFARVVQTGSFTAAAAKLGMPKSTVSRKVTDLEDRLEARLLQRTTRKLSVTDVGRTYYEHCARIVAEMEEAESALSDLHGTPRGLLRITAPAGAGYLGAIVSEFLQRYPEVQIELVCTDRVVDLVEERFDLGVRAGALADSSLIARTLGRASWLLVASPAYLEKHGHPKVPGDLAGQAGLFFGVGAPAIPLRLKKGEAVAEPALPARLLVSNMDVVQAAALAGLGVGLLPASNCAADIRAHKLERLLRDWSAPSSSIHVVYPSTRHLSSKVSRFLEHLQARMTPPPWELGPMA